MAALLVARPQLQRGDDLAVALQLGRRQLARLASIDTPDRLGADMVLKLPIEGGAGDAIETGGTLQKCCAIGMPGRQRVEATAQVDQRLARNPLAATLNHRPGPEPDRRRHGRSPTDGRSQWVPGLVIVAGERRSHRLTASGL